MSMKRSESSSLPEPQPETKKKKKPVIRFRIKREESSSSSSSSSKFTADDRKEQDNNNNVMVIIRKPLCLPVVITLYMVKNQEIFEPIMTHDQLRPIMASLGFVPVGDRSNLRWQEYAIDVTRSPLIREKNLVFDFDMGVVPARPRLPFPNIYQLHGRTYDAFIYLIGIYIGHIKARQIFHIGTVETPEMLYEDEFDIDTQTGAAYRRGSLDRLTMSLSEVYNSVCGGRW